jgi:hypothetical protein
MEEWKGRMDQATATILREAIHSREPVDGLTHGLYRYPARFSPGFARAVIEAFTEPGDVVLDPFVGGGTTLVEARALGRLGVGVDINALSTFLLRAKTTILSEQDVHELRSWGERTLVALNLRRPARRATTWMALGYQTNLTGRTTWPSRKLIELALDSIRLLANARQQRLARAVLLKTAQWALDCRAEIPSARAFREQLLVHLQEVLAGALAFRAAARRADREVEPQGVARTLFLQRSVEGIENEPRLTPYLPPRLVLTSPPYPGVHVLYHRWQVQGRRETPAPFWIADALDGNGPSYYTFGDRKRPGLAPYFARAAQAFTSLARIAGPRTLVVQLVAFAEPSWQLPAYLGVMQDAGFREATYSSLANTRDGRVWRGVPNRKWYARTRGESSASNEVVLFHRRAR